MSQPAEKLQLLKHRGSLGGSSHSSDRAAVSFLLRGGKRMWAAAAATEWDQPFTRTPAVVRALMMNPMMAVNPLLTASGQQRIPLVPSPFRPPIVDRDMLPSTVVSDPRQFCVPPQFGSSVLPNTNMPSMLSNHVYSGWGIAPSESVKAMARRNEMIQRHHTARTEMEMYAIYQQRRMEKVSPKGLAGLGIPLLYGSSIPAGLATYHGRSMLPASDLHFHRSAFRNLPENSMLMATGPHFIDSWGQKCRRLRRGTGNQKVLDNVPETSTTQAEEKVLGQTQAIPYEEAEYAKSPETEAHPHRKSGETPERPLNALTSACGELEPAHRNPWESHAGLAEAKAWEPVQKKTSEQLFAVCGESNEVCPAGSPATLPGTHALVASREHLCLDADIQKWTVDDVHNFISSLPGCSDYAQVFKDHAIDGETLPLLTEEHLRGTMGLKLGPALKIQSQVSQYVGSLFYKKSLSLPTHARQALDHVADPSPLLGFNSWSDKLSISCPQEVSAPKETEQEDMRN